MAAASRVLAITDQARDSPIASGKTCEAIDRYRAQMSQQRTVQDRIADLITRWSGSMAFVYLHIAWFGIWILANTGLLGTKSFDPFPFGLLTMIVSLEAIFLSTFVLVS